MPGPAARATFRGRILSVLLVGGALGAGFVSAAAADDAVIRSTSTRVPYRTGEHQNAPDNRRLISPMGSATGAPPGYYQRHLGWNGPLIEYGPLAAPVVPYVVYVNQPLFAPPPAPEPKVTVINNVTVNNPPPVERVVERVRYEPPARPAEPEAPPAPRPTAPQPVVFEIQPGDALVKLDGRKLGSGADLGSREEPVELSPGVYILQVDHPVYKSQRLVFGVSAELVRVEVDLTAEEPSLRARVR